MAQQQQQQPRLYGMMLSYAVFSALGLLCSLFFNSYYGTQGEDIRSSLHLLSVLSQVDDYSLKQVKAVLEGTDCEEVHEEAKIAEDIKYFMSTKLRYQFDSVVSDSDSMGHCRAIKVYALMRHGTRYPTETYLTRWKELQRQLPERLSSDSALSDAAKALRQWTNPLDRDVTSGRAQPAELAEVGMREQYCLGTRLRERFPHLVKKTYSPLTCGFRSTQVPRAVKSALSYAQGLFQETNPEAISMMSMTEKDDFLLRFNQLPCPEYDRKVTYNKSKLNAWFDSFLDTPAYKGVVKNVQQNFNPERWELGVEDIRTFYTLCIHEMSILGKSSWCDLFEAEDLSVLEFYEDLKAYWKKGAGYAITGERSVHLMQAILEFLTKGKQPVSLNFAHAETVLPLLTLLKAFPVPTGLTPTNYQELKTREFIISRIAPFSANVHLVLYECAQGKSGEVQPADLYVRLLVQEEPREIGLCGSNDTGEEPSWVRSHSLCRLDRLRDNAYKATRGFSLLTELCKVQS